MRITFRWPAQKNEKFTQEAFTRSVGKRIDVNLPSQTYSGLCEDVVVGEDGTYADVCINVEDAPFFRQLTDQLLSQLPLTMPIPAAEDCSRRPESPLDR